MQWHSSVFVAHWLLLLRWLLLLLVKARTETALRNEAMEKWCSSEIMVVLPSGFVG